MPPKGKAKAKEPEPESDSGSGSEAPPAKPAAKADPKAKAAEAKPAAKPAAKKDESGDDGSDDGSDDGGDGSGGGSGDEEPDDKKGKGGKGGKDSKADAKDAKSDAKADAKGGKADAKGAKADAKADAKGSKGGDDDDGDGDGGSGDEEPDDKKGKKDSKGKSDSKKKGKGGKGGEDDDGEEGGDGDDDEEGPPSKGGGKGGGKGGKAKKGKEDEEEAEPAGGDLEDLFYECWAEKKAFKTLLKQNWKRRYIDFDPYDFTIKWWVDDKAFDAGKGGGTVGLKGTFEMDAETFAAALTDEHAHMGKQFEVKIESGQEADGNYRCLYLAMEEEANATDLLRFMGLARNARVKAINQNEDFLGEVKEESGLEKGESPGNRVFSWGVGTLQLSAREPAHRGMSVPKRVADIGSTPGASAVAAGPEHAVALVAGEARLWGSNEFSQLGQSPDELEATTAKTAVLLTPGPAPKLGGRQPLASVSVVACGGAHSLAVAGGKLYAWGTGTVGQLGLGRDIQVQEVYVYISAGHCPPPPLI